MLIQRTYHHPGLKSIVDVVANPLQDSMALLSRYMENEIPFVDKVLQHGNMISGKRLRPTLLLLVAGNLGNIDRRHIALAAAIEMIHTATLVHDDIIDEASTRRHLPSVHERWNSPTAVLLGDYLFSNAFYLAATTDSARACRLIGNSTNQVCEGELQQLSFEQNFEISQEQYIEIILGKTGRLISCATELATLFQEDHGFSGEAHETIATTMREFGAKLGIAFQIQDDILDIMGHSESTGKTLGTDMQNQKATLPVIRSLRLLTEKPRNELLEHLKNPTQENVSAAIEIMRQVGAIDYSKTIAAEYAQQAASCLSELPDNEYRQALLNLVDFSVQRSG